MSPADDIATARLLALFGLCIAAMMTALLVLRTCDAVPLRPMPAPAVKCPPPAPTSPGDKDSRLDVDVIRPAVKGTVQAVDSI